jgi:hypothetical protein
VDRQESADIIAILSAVSQAQGGYVWTPQGGTGVYGTYNKIFLRIVDRESQTVLWNDSCDERLTAAGPAK